MCVCVDLVTPMRFVYLQIIAIFEKDQIQIEEIIVYGIGKLIENISAQYQIAVLLLLMDSFPKASKIKQLNLKLVSYTG